MARVEVCNSPECEFYSVHANHYCAFREETADIRKIKYAVEEIGCRNAEITQYLDTVFRRAKR